MRADTAPAQSATMGSMGWGKRRQMAKAPAVELTARGLPAAAPVADPPDPLPDSDAADADLGLDADALHFCCICGALLGFDFEDEIDGEGCGRDICGNCNRTKNFETMVGNE